MLRLNCFFEAKDTESFDKALIAAKDLTIKSQTHEGCLAYDVFVSATRANVFTICETWKDEESLTKHAETPEFKEAVPIIQACGELKIEKLSM